MRISIYQIFKKKKLLMIFEKNANLKYNPYSTHPVTLYIYFEVTGCTEYGLEN